jgi:hypothetical protein
MPLWVRGHAVRQLESVTARQATPIAMPTISTC